MPKQRSSRKRGASQSAVVSKRPTVARTRNPVYLGAAAPAPVFESKRGIAMFGRGAGFIDRGRHTFSSVPCAGGHVISVDRASALGRCDQGPGCTTSVAMTPSVVSSVTTTVDGSTWVDQVVARRAAIYRPEQGPNEFTVEINAIAEKPFTAQVEWFELYTDKQTLA